MAYPSFVTDRLDQLIWVVLHSNQEDEIFERVCACIRRGRRDSEYHQRAQAHSNVWVCASTAADRAIVLDADGNQTIIRRRVGKNRKVISECLCLNAN